MKMTDAIDDRAATIGGIAVLLGCAGLIVAAPARAASASDAQARAAWRETIVHVLLPRAGCFTAAYPSTVWSKVGCTVAPRKP